MDFESPHAMVVAWNLIVADHANSQKLYNRIIIGTKENDLPCKLGTGRSERRSKARRRTWAKHMGSSPHSLTGLISLGPPARAFACIFHPGAHQRTKPFSNQALRVAYSNPKGFIWRMKLIEDFKMTRYLHHGLLVRKIGCPQKRKHTQVDSNKNPRKREVCVLSKLRFAKQHKLYKLALD